MGNNNSININIKENYNNMNNNRIDDSDKNLSNNLKKKQ